MPPSNAVIRVRDPGLVHDEKGPPEEEQRPKRAKRNIVLKEDIAPSDRAPKGKRTGPANHREWKDAASFSLGDDAHLMTKGHKLAREKLRGRFDPARAWKKMVRSEQDFHGTDRVSSAKPGADEFPKRRSRPSTAGTQFQKHAELVVNI